MLKSLTPGVKPWVIKSFLTSDSINRTLKCDHYLECFWAVLCCGVLLSFIFPICHFRKFINFGLVTVSSKRFKGEIILKIK